MSWQRQKSQENKAAFLTLIKLFTFPVCHSVAQRHQIVAEVNVLNDRVAVLGADVEVAEIPEAFYAQLI